MAVTSALPDLGTILSIWAHPDDESYGCAGIMAAAVRAGQRVVCVTATRGELGSTDPERWPNGPGLAEVRTAELAASLAEIGVTEHHWLDYADGGCADVDEEEAVGRLRDLIGAVAPDTILTFGPDGGTFHPDHMTVSRWVTAAAAGRDVQVHYATTTPEWREIAARHVDLSTIMMGEGTPASVPADECSIFMHLDGELLDIKARAMLCQESQVGPMLAMLGPDNFRAMLAEEAFCRPEDFPPL